MFKMNGSYNSTVFLTCVKNVWQYKYIYGYHIFVKLQTIIKYVFYIWKQLDRPQLGTYY